MKNPSVALLAGAIAASGLLAPGLPTSAAPRRVSSRVRKAPPTPRTPKPAVRKTSGRKLAPRKTVVPAEPVGPVLEALQIQPPAVTLEGPRARQLLVVTGRYSDGSLRDLSTQVKYVAVQAGVASITAEGLVKPVADGETVVKAYVGRIGARVPVTVAATGDAGPPSFMRDVVPVLTQAGCNSLACHGSPAGKAGFKLSMYGFEPNLDFEAIVKQERPAPEKGKRIDLGSVDQSLLLAKPTMRTPHQGGMRFKAGSPEYRLLEAWLKAGAPMDPLDPLPVVTRVEVLPPERVLPKTGVKQRLVVMAHYSDGTSEDVTHKAIYASNDDAVATPDAGEVTATGVGETIVLARYLGRVGTAQFLIPQPAPVTDREYAGFQPVNFIDQLALAKWKKMRFVPSEPATDAEFLRRVSLDLTGTLPTAAEVREFLAACEAERRAGAANKAPGSRGAGSKGELAGQSGYGLAGRRGARERGAGEKRAPVTAAASASRSSGYAIRNTQPAAPVNNTPALKTRARLIDALLNRPEYSDWWTLFWGDVLRNNSRLVQANGAKAYREWIHKNVAENRPYHEFVRELVTASGKSFTNGAANFFRVARNPQEQAEQTAQVFLGVRLQCANCHNHPSEKWTRTSYHRFAALFSRTTAKNTGKGEVEILANPKGSYRSPVTNRPLEPAVLADNPLDMPADRDYREVLGEWLVSPDNPLFARNLVNRVWAQLFGRGIIDPVDDVRVTNPPVNEALLDALARDFVAHNYDVKHLLRTIASSRTYQLSVRANRWNGKDRQNFSRAYHRRLKAEALLDAICQVTEQPESFRGHPAGTRAIQLVDNRVASYFMDIFGRPRREVVCACEREETANLTQALHLINGDTINQKIAAAKGRVARLLDPAADPPQSDAAVLEELYLWSLGRFPTPEESAEAIRQIAAAGKERRSSVEDLLWVLLNSTEFQFNH